MISQREEQSFTYFHLRPFSALTSSDMGNGESSEEEKKEDKSPVIDQSRKVTEVSTGFHVMEVHMPTLGMGLTWLIILLMLIIAAILLYRRYVRRWNRRQSSHPAGALPLFHRRQDPSPSVYYVVSRNDIPTLHQPPQRRFEELPPDDGQPASPSASSSGSPAARFAGSSFDCSNGPLNRAWRGEEQSPA